MVDRINYNLFVGKNISNIAYGCATLANIYNPLTDNKSNDIIDFCIKNGINYFDVAPFYGGGLAEQRLGKALNSTNRDALFIATKVGRYTNEESVSGAGGYFDFSPSRIEESIKNSMKNIGINYIDLLQCHDIEHVTTDTILNALPILEHFKNIGYINAIGINSYPIQPLIDVIENTQIKIDSVGTYAHFTLINNSLNNYIPYFQNKNIKIINSSPLSMGLLTEKGPPNWHPASETMLNIVSEIKTLCNSKNENISDIAMKYSLNNEDILTTISGGNSVDEIMNNINSLNSTLDGNLMKEIEIISEPIKNKLWGPEDGVTPVFNWEYLQ